MAGLQVVSIAAPGRIVVGDADQPGPDVESVYIPGPRGLGERSVGNDDFTVGQWDMTSVLSPVAPAQSHGATLGGADPNYTISSFTAPLSGGPYLYSAGCETGGGVPVSASGAVWAKFVMPSSSVGDNAIAYAFLIVNENAIFDDVVAAINEQSIDETISIISGVFVLQNSEDCSFINYPATGGPGPEGFVAVAGETIYFGLDYDSGNVLIQKEGGTVYTSPFPIDTSLIVGGEKLKLIFAVLFESSNPVLSAGQVMFNPSTTDSGRYGFYSMSDAELPSGAIDGDVFEVIAGGDFGGDQTQVGDFVRLYDNTSKIIITRLPTVDTADISGLQDQIDGVVETVTTQGETITSIQGDVQTQGTQISGLEGDVIELQSLIDDLQLQADEALVISGGSAITSVDICEYSTVVFLQDAVNNSTRALQAVYSGGNIMGSESSPDPYGRISLRPLRLVWIVRNSASVTTIPGVATMQVLERSGGNAVLENLTLSLHGMSNLSLSEPVIKPVVLAFEITPTVILSNGAVSDVAFSRVVRLDCAAQHPDASAPGITDSNLVHSADYYPGVYVDSGELVVKPFMDDYAPGVVVIDSPESSVVIYGYGAGKGKRVLLFKSYVSAVQLYGDFSGLTIPTSFDAGTIIEIYGDKSGDCYVTSVNGNSLQRKWKVVDFIHDGGSSAEGGFATGTAGGAYGYNPVVGETSAAYGGVTTSTSATGSIAERTATNAFNAANGSLYYLHKDAFVTALSDGSNSYVCYSGFSNTSTGAEPTNGAYFEYDPSVSVYWRCVTAADGVRTKTTTDVPVKILADGPDKLQVKIQNGIAKFWINNVLVHTTSSTMPTGWGQAFGAAAAIRKTGGTTARGLAFDMLYVRQELLTERDLSEPAFD